MSEIKTFRDPELSRWLSVVDEVVSEKPEVAASGQRPSLADPMIEAAAAVGTAVVGGIHFPVAAATAAAAAAAGTVAPAPPAASTGA
ncbi:MAG TPA: hypothetical protein VGE98_11530, partial [Thermoanaerobaculia bacterium]